MPVYEFECPECGYVTEVITIHEKIKDGAECAQCGGHATYIMSPSNFHTDETRARRILGKGRKARGTRGRGPSQEERWGRTWYEKTGRNHRDDLESGKKVND